MARPLLVAFACAFLLVLGGCTDAEGFLCLDNAECGDEGFCEDNGSCSFADSSCESGRRYGEFAPGRIADACVAEESGPPPETAGVMPASGVCGQEESCESCLSCAAEEEPCAEQVMTCSTSDVCVDGLSCAQACLGFGDCADCCAGASSEDRELIMRVNDCQVSECSALCGESRVPECAPP